MKALRSIIREVLFEALQPHKHSFAHKVMNREFRFRGVPEHTFYGKYDSPDQIGGFKYSFYFIMHGEGFKKVGYLNNGNLFGLRELTQSDLPSNYTLLGTGYGKRVGDAAKVIFHHMNKITGPDGMFAMKFAAGTKSYIIYGKEGHKQYGGIVGKLYDNGFYEIKLDDDDLRDFDEEGTGFKQGPEKFMHYIWLKRHEEKTSNKKKKVELGEEFSARANALVYKYNNKDANSKLYQETLVAEFPDVDGMYVTRKNGKHQEDIWVFYSKNGKYVGGISTLEKRIFWSTGHGQHAKFFEATPNISYDHNNPDLKNAARFLYLNVLQKPKKQK